MKKRIQKYHPLYRRWTYMRAAVSLPSSPDYARQGAQGITMDPRFWDFWQYVRLVESKLGACPGPDYRLGRKDQHGDWVLSNMSWSTAKDVGSRLDKTIKIRYQGRSQSLTDWSVETGINYHTLIHRYRYGWPVKLMLTQTPSLHNARSKRQ